MAYTFKTATQSVEFGEPGRTNRSILPAALSEPVADGTRVTAQRGTPTAQWRLSWFEPGRRMTEGDFLKLMAFLSDMAWTVAVFTWVDADGTERAVRLASAPVFDEDGYGMYSGELLLAAEGVTT